VPELPEVETMVRGLRPAMVGRRVVRMNIKDAAMLSGVGPTTLERRVRGRLVQEILRRGKWVVMVMEPPAGVLIIQPRMTGAFSLAPPERPEHVRLEWRLEAIDGSGDAVWYTDTRRLGRFLWRSSMTEAEATFEASQGPDTLAISRTELTTRLGRTRRSIKPALMDQKVVAGLGNIYADEILHRARIHPTRPAKDLTTAELRRLHRALGAVLEEAIRAEGSSFDRDYRTVLGREGGFLRSNAAYGRAGEPCPRCRTPIERIRFVGLIGRSTYLCPRCQPSKETCLDPKRADRRVEA